MKITPRIRNAEKQNTETYTVKGLCEHCGKKRTYQLKINEVIDDYTECKFCKKAGALVEIS